MRSRPTWTSSLCDTLFVLFFIFYLACLHLGDALTPNLDFHVIRRSQACKKKNLAYEEEDKNAWGMRRSIHEVEGLFLVGH